MAIFAPRFEVVVGPDVPHHPFAAAGALTDGDAERERVSKGSRQ
jgi:hypothetical protein